MLTLILQHFYYIKKTNLDFSENVFSTTPLTKRQGITLLRYVLCEVFFCDICFVSAQKHLFPHAPHKLILNKFV